MGSDGRGQREAGFHRLYQANFRPVQAYVVNRVGRADDVLDIWLYGTARRVIARRCRSASRLRNLLGRLAAHQDRRPPLAWEDDPVQGTVLAALAQLKPTDREALLLVHWEGLSYAEAAEALGCSVNAVGIRVHKAKARLRELLGARPGAARATRRGQITRSL